MSPYINIKDKTILNHGNSISIITSQKSSFFYDILRSKMYVKPYLENSWEHVFNTSSGHWNWKAIYTRKLINVKHRKLAEFNFKVLHNILPCGKIVSKWD